MSDAETNPQTNIPSATRDELIFLYLRLQRALILFAIVIFEPRNEHTKFGSHILDLKESNEILIYLNYLKSLHRLPAVKFASQLHRLFDSYKVLKLPFVTLSLYLRFAFRRLNSQSARAKYANWVSQKDSPTDDQVLVWAETMKNDRLTAVLFLPEAFGHISDIVESVQSIVKFKAECFFYGSDQNHIQLKEQFEKSGISANEPIFHFVKQSDFNTDLRNLTDELSHKKIDWLIIQNDSGVIAKRNLKEVSQWLKLNNEKAAIAYSDSDSLDKNHMRFNPKFHSDWNLRYFVGQNCCQGLAIVNRSQLANALLSNEIVSWPKLLVTLIEKLDPEQIGHIPKILFHGRNPIFPQQKELLQELNLRLEAKYNAHINITPNGSASIVWPLPKVLPKVSILIPTRDKIHLVKNLLNGILKKTDYPNIEIVIVDNQSVELETKKYFSEISKDSRIKVVSYPFPFNYSAINNFGFKYCTGEILALLNNDIEVMRADWLKEAVREALAPQVGVVGCKLYYRNGFIQHAGVVLTSNSAYHVHSFERRSSPGYCNRLQFPHELTAVTAACMIMRSEVFSKAGGFNEIDLAVAYNDIDLCLRIRDTGLKVVWSPKIELLHLESASRPPDTGFEQILRYRREVEYMHSHWGHIMKTDPFYNANFAAYKLGFDLP